MSISIVFSFAIYNVTSNELDNRLIHFQSNLQSYGRPFIPAPDVNQFRIGEAHEASDNILIGLVYANLLILIVGGSLSYLLARKTLKPIQLTHEMQSRFTSDASHELRTPLASMKTEIEVALKDKDLSSNDARELLKSNLEEVNKLSKLSEMLLNLSMLDNEKLEKKAVDLNETTNEVIGRFKQYKDRIKVQIKKRSTVLGNETAIGELISVLVDNAFKYSTRGSLVTVNLSSDNDFACIEVTNSGEGISEDELPLIFDRFYRADKSRTSGANKGYGLGLSIAKKIVELHGGELDVTSTPGELTTFTVLLPLFEKSPSKN